MQSPQVLYATPAGRLMPSLRVARVFAFAEGMRVSLPAPLPSERRGL